MVRTRFAAALRRLPWLAACLAVAAGCTRAFFRERADRDVEGLLQEKSVDPRWAVDGTWYVYPDPRARFTDFDKSPDHPKKPPDDPAAAATSCLLYTSPSPRDS